MKFQNYIQNKCIISLIIAFSSPICFAQSSLRFSGNSLHPIEIEPERNTGLDKIYVLYDTKGVSATFTVDPIFPVGDVKWYKYSNLGGGYAQEISDVRTQDNLSIVDNIEGDMGYIIEVDGNRSYFWIVNYLPHRLNLHGLSVSGLSDCDYTYLDLDGNADPIHYFTINGQQRVLSRELRLDYESQQWNETLQKFDNYTVSKILESVNESVSVTPPPYCATYFTLTGDRFLEEWNWGEQVQSNVADPVAVAVHTEAEQAEKDSEDSEGGSNEIKTSDSGLGGSAPAEIEFKAFTTEGVIHHEWQMTKDPNFEDIEYRFNEQNLSYSFNEEGTFYLRYIGSNSDGSCEAFGDVYTVNIGASELRCPNAFSPDGDGVNDEWKVSYRSIIDFDCWIFDKNGHEIIHLDSPTKGWDGKRGGKLVGPGVYFYVIKATGADGKKYKKSGDINIIRHRSFTNGSGSSSSE